MHAPASSGTFFFSFFLPLKWPPCCRAACMWLSCGCRLPGASARAHRYTLWCRERRSAAANARERVGGGGGLNAAEGASGEGEQRARALEHFGGQIQLALSSAGTHRPPDSQRATRWRPCPPKTELAAPTRKRPDCAETGRISRGRPRCQALRPWRTWSQVCAPPNMLAPGPGATEGGSGGSSRLARACAPPWGVVLMRVPALATPLRPLRIGSGRGRLW